MFILAFYIILANKLLCVVQDILCKILSYRHYVYIVKTLELLEIYINSLGMKKI